MCGDREARFALDVLFGEVDVSLGCRVDDFNVDTLTGAGSDVGGDDDEGVRVCCVPCALVDGDFSGREGEFDGGGEGQEQEEDENETSNEEHDEWMLVTSKVYSRTLLVKSPVHETRLLGGISSLTHLRQPGLGPPMA